jgi:hypothetical protein
MDTMLPLRGLSIATLLCVGCALSSAQQESWMADRDLSLDLRQNGVRYELDSAIVYFDKDGLTDEQMAQFATLVDQGVADIENVMKVSPERRERIGKVQYFVSNNIGISHSRFRAVYMSTDRVRREAAPYLHETTHIIAPCNACPTWLSEGLASFVQSYVSEHIGGYDGAIFSRGGNREIDQSATRWLHSPRGQAVLPFVGTRGEPPGLDDDRRGVGAPFYVLSQSFVKFLVDRAGPDALGTIAGSSDPGGAIEQSTKSTLADLKTQWLASIDGESALGSR